MHLRVDEGPVSGRCSDTRSVPGNIKRTFLYCARCLFCIMSTFDTFSKFGGRSLSVRTVHGSRSRRRTLYPTQHSATMHDPRLEH